MRFSIIIPAYNSSGYIRKALESIRSQVFTDYELIVVCDSCTDNTEEIAKEYGARTFAVDYHCDGLTRNVGIDNARGDWILFMDDDDWWLHEYVLSIIDQLLGDYDVLRFSFIWKGVGYAKCGPYIAVWNKCWRRSFIGDTRFPGRLYWSDVNFNEAMMLKSPRIVDVDTPLYYYNYLRPGSISEQHGP